MFTEHEFTKGVIVDRQPQQDGLGFYNLAYFRGERGEEGIQFPTDGSYLDPESEYRFKFQDLLSWIEDYVQTGTILDVGCGPAHLAYWAEKQERPFEVVSCDLSEAILRWTKDKRDSEKCVAGLAHQLPFQSGYFQGVLFSDILEHMWPEEALEAIREGYRLLRPEGYTFVNIPNRNTWSAAALKDKGHVWLPSRKEVVQLLTKGGFSEKEIDIFTRGYPGSRFYRQTFGRDLRIPWFGRSIFASAKKQ